MLRGLFEGGDLFLIIYGNAPIETIKLWKTTAYRVAALRKNV